MPDTVTVEQDAFEPAPVEEPQVLLTADRGDGVPLLVARDPAGRERRVVQEHDACARADGGGQRVQVEPPVPPCDAERDEPWYSPDEADPVQHPGVGRIGENDFVPGIGEAEEGVEHRVPLATRDHDFTAPVVMWSAATLDGCGHRLLEIVAACKRKPAVRFVFADSRAR